MSAAASLVGEKNAQNLINYSKY